MIREEALFDEYGNYKYPSDVELTELNTATSMPYKDAISRQYLLDNCVVDKVTMPYVPISKIENAPPVAPQPKIGHWIEEIDDYGKVMRWHCDKCYQDSGFTTTCKWDFCPNCGAKMVNSQESEE